MIEGDRFARTGAIAAGGRDRARRLRAEPTWTEAKLWERLRLLPIRIRRQAPIGPFIADFACLRARLVIEVDGGVHNLTDVAVRDLKRDAWLADQGYRVLRIDSRRIPEDLEAVVAEVVETIRQTAPLPLEGEGVGGWGGGAVRPNANSKTPASSSSDRRERACTPPNPPPRGEGF